MDNSTLDLQAYDSAAAIVSFALFTLIVSFNSIVIYLLTYRNKKRTRLHFFILHLAIADFLVGAYNCLGDGIENTLQGVWYGGDVFCKVWRYMKIVLIVASNNLLIGLAVDRFLAVRCPMKFVKIGNKLDKCLVIGAWALGFTLPVFVIPFTKVDTEEMCEIALPSAYWKPYVVTIVIAEFVLPMILISFCYIGICIVVWQKWRSGLQLCEVNRSHESLHGRQSNNTGLLPKAKIKSIKMTIIVCIAFFVCWTPYFVVSLMDTFNTNAISRPLYMIIGMLYPLNSACNPLIFIAFNIRMFKSERGYHQGTTFLLDKGATVTHDIRLSNQSLNSLNRRFNVVVS